MPTIGQEGEVLEQTQVTEKITNADDDYLAHILMFEITVAH